MTKIIAVLILIVSTATAFAQTPPTPPCPAKINLVGPAFLGGASFPVKAQIQTNFENRFKDDHGRSLWQPTDVELAEKFVNITQAALKNNAIELDLSLDDQAECVGHISTAAGALSYSYDVFSTTLNFQMDTFGHDAVQITLGEKVPVQFRLNFPSDCSACSGAAELFQFNSATKQ